jgi:hypothetical protein
MEPRDGRLNQGLVATRTTRPCLLQGDSSKETVDRSDSGRQDGTSKVNDPLSALRLVEAVPPRDEGRIPEKAHRFADGIRLL